MEKMPGKRETLETLIIKSNSPSEEEWKNRMEEEIAGAKYSVEWRDERRAKADEDDKDADWIPNNHTELSAEKAQAFYTRLLEIAKTFDATCEIRLEQPAHYGDNKAHIIFTVNDNGERKEFTYDKELLIEEEDDDHIRDFVLGIASPEFFKPNNLREPSGFAYEYGWNDNDIKNEIVRATTLEALDELAGRAEKK